MARKKRSANFVELPPWTYENSPKDMYTLASALTLAGLENKWFKLTAAEQRKIIGANRLGSQSVGLFKGELMVSRSVAFGTDWDTRYVSDRNMTGKGKI